MQALLDLATDAALGRRFNPVLDLPLVADGWRLACGEPRRAARAAAAAVALAAGVALAVAALWWAAGRLPVAAAPGARGALAVPLARARRARRRPGDRLRPARQRRRVAPRLGASARRLARARATSPASAPRPRPTTGPARRPATSCRRCRAATSSWSSSRSYGRSAHENPLYAPTVAAALAEAEARLAAAGLAARSAWLTSPVVGGQSWLAHATLLSGLAVDSEGRYRALLASPRRTLLHLARAAGWSTAAVMPAITLPWPEAGWFGYDSVLAAKDLGYRGRPFNWVTMPDQFTLACARAPAARPAPAARRSSPRSR